ncbi:signal transduction histidine kinase [Paenibacillus phyllosphaerae]|uniref:histidine kinase n=1 Tax=Paenibacillus phyllosphaerae TaxID=274593 RepID=A0A7W5FP73_9BACL|nr:HAMP domain-containing sensor histidine kinase [Paenibacillus phyllosphaerae]MBB3111943.1 signal transduction histidine kinase [Paenibacillus phyllosphaerae]
MTSLRTRMVWSFGMLIVLVVVMLGSLFVTLVWNYYYGSAVSSLMQRAQTEAALHNRNLSAQPMRTIARYMLQNMTAGTAHLQLLDHAGNLIVDSNGMPGDGRVLATPDVASALNGQQGSWRGKDPVTGERIAAVTLPVKRDQRVVALFRYTASLQGIDAIVRNMIFVALLGAIIVVLLFFGMSVLMANRIARPIRNLTKVAEQMAEGNWTRRAEIGEQDEIGRLADTLNTMAAEITRREKLKNDFISSISHELRTPLTSIKGWSETLASGDPTDVEEVRMGLAVIDRETDRLAGLVEDLLDFSKLYAKNIVLHPEPLDFLAPIKETVRQFEARAHREGIRLAAGLADNGPLLVEADANRLKQVLINVLDNAFKFTPKGGQVMLTAERIGDDVQVRIADSGIGIDPADLPHVTDKFYKGNSQRAGSGLGLAICKEIVELHGGTLELASIVEEGTTVTVRLPLMKLPQEAIVSIEEGTAES